MKGIAEDDEVEEEEDDDDDAEEGRGMMDKGVNDTGAVDDDGAELLLI